MKKQLQKILLSGIFLCNALCLFGQGLCDVGGGGFDLDQYEGCAPLTVKIQNTVPNSFGVGYDVSYNGISLNPLLAQGLPSTTYYYAGDITILQGGSVSTGPFYACKKLKIYESRHLNVQYASCGGGKVKLFFSDDDILRAYDKIEINWGDNKEIWNKGNALELEHNYASGTISPIVKIKGLYTSNTACSEGLELSFGIPLQQPFLKNIQVKTVVMRGNGGLEVTYEGVTSIQTDILTSVDGGTNYVVGGSRTSGGIQFYRIPSLNASQVYQVKLASKDLCGGKQDSDVVTSMVLKGISADEKNSISWNQYPNAADFQEYQLMRDGTLLKSFTDINTTSFEDEGVQCGDYYEYSVIAVTKTINSISASVNIRTTTESPKSIEQAYVTVKRDDLIEVTAIIPGSGSKTNYEVTIQRAEGAEGTFKKISTLYSETTYEDSDVEANNNSYCYRLIYQNACGQKSPVSEPICSVLLQNTSSIFTWTTNKPFLDDIKAYSMIQTGSSGSNAEVDMKLQNTFAPKLTGQSDPQYTFQIRTDSKGGNFQSFSNLIAYKRDADIFVPTAFSPNEDGINDVFEARVSMYQSFNMSVLNRWGEVIFHSDDILKGWDGMIKGQLAPVGSYIFNIEIVNNINQTVKKSGTFVLLK